MTDLRAVLGLLVLLLIAFTFSEGRRRSRGATSAQVGDLAPVTVAVVTFRTGRLRHPDSIAIAGLVLTL